MIITFCDNLFNLCKQRFKFNLLCKNLQLFKTNKQTKNKYFSVFFLLILLTKKFMYNYKREFRLIYSLSEPVTIKHTTPHTHTTHTFTHTRLHAHTHTHIYIYILYIYIYNIYIYIYIYRKMNKLFK